MLFLATACIASEACGGATWTARVCTSNAVGNCEAIDGQSYRYAVKSENVVHSVNGLTDVVVKDPACTGKGIGEVDVNVLDHDHLDVTVYCLIDKPVGVMTIPAEAAPPPPDVPGPRSTSDGAPH
jgi:hypothetical protein